MLEHEVLASNPYKGMVDYDEHNQGETQQRFNSL